MDENQNNVKENTAQAAPTNDSQNMPAQATSANYASFWQRLAAMLIDGLALFVIGIVLGFVSGFIFGLAGDTGAQLQATTSSWVSTLVGWIYYVYFTSSRGATPGKMVMNIRVQNMDTGANLTYVEAFLREVVGKFLSTVVILLGYFWMLWDPKKQTWHDKLAKSVVVKTK